MLSGCAAASAKGSLGRSAACSSGLIHTLNAFFGQSLGSTIQQIGFAFLAGSAFYITRRVTGTLLRPACWCTRGSTSTTIGLSKASADSGSIFNLLTFAQYLAYALALVGVVVVLRQHSRYADPVEQAAVTV